MHSKSDNVEITINNKANEVTEELLTPLTKKYQLGLEKSMSGSDFIFDWVHFLYLLFICYKINSESWWIKYI